MDETAVSLYYQAYGVHILTAPVQIFLNFVYGSVYLMKE